MERRISHSELFNGICNLIADRSTCERKRVGALIVKNNRIISTGYAGAPSGLLHCLDVGCEVVNDHCIRTMHAEANAISFAAKHGISTEGASLYCTYSPCKTCAGLILNSGIVEVFYQNLYDKEGLYILRSGKCYSGFIDEEGP